MNTSHRHIAWAVGLALAFGGCAAQAASFTYHGSLDDGGRPASGRYDLRVTPYGSEKAVAPLADAVTLYGVEVKDGRFSTEVDFGSVAVGDGWIGVAVRKAGGGEFAELGGRSEINGSGACWSTTGNAGTAPGVNYLGTSDDQPLIFGARGLYAGQFTPTADSVAFSIGSSSADGKQSMAMGDHSEAHGGYSFAGGHAKTAAGHDRSFIWGGSGRDFSYSGAADQFIIGADGGVGINTNTFREFTTELQINPRPDPFDLRDVEIALITDDKWANIYLTRNTGRLNLNAGGGVHIVTQVEISGNLTVNGEASKSTAGAWQANSDGRIKQDIQPIDSALDTLAKVHPVSFRYTDAYRAAHPEVADQRYYNVIAQQFAEVFPDAVTKSGEYLPGAEKNADNEILQVDTYPAQIVTIAAVQELAQKNAALEATVQKLMARLAKLEAKGK
ncbi:tail fiber domain-containing protein [Dokdonella sp.]|uniref:tail fiber domain-containing protein n=1 Tax=Dokdonella sp. TaxID=2291710 RepID=UPI001B0651D1|nr:tail fiber domain-containing protein [Dokdonella sp.]MBO9662573.1 tail fiber domain-containing protein [Dokdonella sp.]